MSIILIQGQTRQKGFTLIELLIVIVVIAILAAITLVAYNGVQVKARDSLRAQDIASIKKALLIYDINNGGVPRTSSYGGTTAGGWNLSSASSWLSFLKPSINSIPVDPVNTGIVNPDVYELVYAYYCYPSGSAGYTTPTVVLSYWSESSKAHVSTSFVVDQCL